MKSGKVQFSWCGGWVPAAMRFSSRPVSQASRREGSGHHAGSSRNSSVNRANTNKRMSGFERCSLPVGARHSRW
jgi:hypothetical protein